MVTISRGDIWWADLADPKGPSPGFRRPVVILQSDALNRSRIATIVCVPLTSNINWAEAPGNVLLSSTDTGLSKDSVANVSQITAIDKLILMNQVGKIPERKLDLIMRGIDIILGR